MHASRRVRVDYHFHPNLPLRLPVLGKRLSRRKAERIWRAFAEHGLHMVFVSEHVYKRPRTSYEFLLQHRPEDACTHLVPAVEYLTAEGVDIIIFAERPECLYCHEELLIPWKLSAEDVIAKIRDDPHLKGIVVHPCTPGATSIVRKCGREFARSAVEDLGFVEAHNCSAAALQELLDVLKLERFFRKKYGQIVETLRAPDDLCCGCAVRTGGSDAHQVWEIGDCMELACEHRDDPQYLFSAATTMSGILCERERRYKRALPINTVTVLHEWLLKSTRLYTVDDPL